MERGLEDKRENIGKEGEKEKKRILLKRMEKLREKEEWNILRNFKMDKVWRGNGRRKIDEGRKKKKMKNGGKKIEWLLVKKSMKEKKKVINVEMKVMEEIDEKRDRIEKIEEDEEWLRKKRKKGLKGMKMEILRIKMKEWESGLEDRRIEEKDREK